MIYLPENWFMKDLEKATKAKEIIAGRLQEDVILEQHETIERLKEKCDQQAMILRRLMPDKFPDTLFISGVLGQRDKNNMPEKLMVVPAYGVDFCYIYEYTGKTTGQEW